MDTLGKRLKHVISHYGMTMTSFAEKLSISQSMISKICKDNANPSDRTVSDICRIYQIRKDWLLNGTGEMIDTSPRQTALGDQMLRECAELILDAVCKNDQYISEDDIFSQMNETAPVNPEIVRKLARALSCIPTKFWPILVRCAEILADESAKPTDYDESYIAGYEAGIMIRQVITSAIKDETSRAQRR